MQSEYIAPSQRGSKLPDFAVLLVKIFSQRSHHDVGLAHSFASSFGKFKGFPAKLTHQRPRTAEIQVVELLPVSLRRRGEGSVSCSWCRRLPNELVKGDRFTLGH